MQQTMIVIRGKQGVGKTTSIKMAYDALRIKVKAPIPPYLQKEVIGKILVIDGVNVGFSSKGDIQNDVRASIKSLIKQDCKVIVCATRPAGTVTADVVESYRDEFAIVSIEKEGASSEKQHEISNQEMAATIVKEVEKAVRRAK